MRQCCVNETTAMVLRSLVPLTLRSLRFEVKGGKDLFERRRSKAEFLDRRVDLGMF